MLRYTTIHHEVREQFELSFCEYMVCDSIYQLSYSKPTDVANVVIAKFLGIDEGSVRKAKKTLLEKGLIYQEQDSFKATELWHTSIAIRKNSDKFGKIPNHSIYTNKDNTSAKAEKEGTNQKTTYQELDINSDGEPIYPDRPKKDVSRGKEIKEVFKLFDDNPEWLLWLKRPLEREAAKLLLDKYGLETIGKLYLDAKKYRSDPLCPQIYSPSTLLQKFIQMKNYIQNGRH